MHTLEQLVSGQLQGSTELRLACGLTEFPRAIFDLADTLEVLDLSGNALTSLPDDLPRLHQLRILFASDNLFTELPAVLGRCPQLTMIGFKANRIRQVPDTALPRALRWLILTDNQLESLPSSIGQCRQLQKLMLAGNRLRALPDALAQCQKLELLRLAANQLTALPAWLTHLPRLSWLAYAGNPLCEAQETQARQNAPIRGMAWDQLQLGPVLGQGASGVIYRAAYRSGLTAEGSTAVAVKLFKGQVTSDGLPLSEMAACIHAGAHPHLIPAIAKVTGHPSDAQGLVMPLVSADFANLAGPPSLASCTRDIYQPESRFDLATVKALAGGIAQAANHLHARGLLHGDLYAHNILDNGQGLALLGDFGAASFLPPEDAAMAQALQRLEVRAFGCLLEELMARCPVTATDTPSDRRQRLIQLKDQCLGEVPGLRPLFKDIAECLARS